MTGKRRAGRTAGSPPEQPGSARTGRVDPMVVPPTRREMRLARRQAFRRKVGLAGGIAIVVAIVAVLVGVSVGVHTVVAHHHSTPVAASQTTLLVQIQAADGTATGSTLLAHDPARHQGLELAVPARLITGVCGYGELPFGQVLALPGGSTVSRQALSTELGGVSISGSWVLTTAQLATLVDAEHGVVVDVDTDVIRRGAQRDTVDIPKGDRQPLSGAKAAEYATYRTSPNEDASGNELRLQRVLDAMLRALPTAPTDIDNLLRRLGPSAQSSVGTARLGSLLAGLASDDRVAGGTTPTDLPVTSIDAGGSAPSYSGATPAIDSLVKSSLAASLPTSHSAPISVELLNGVGKPGLVATACPRLAANGLSYAGSGNASSFGQPRSSVQVAGRSQLPTGQRVARALGLPRRDVELSGINQSVADVLVVLGRDYRH